MRRIQLILVAALATLGISALGATSAFAVPAPLWFVEGAQTYHCVEGGVHHEYETLLDCLAGSGPVAGEWERITLTNVTGLLQLDEGAEILSLSLGAFKLSTAVETISCTHEHDEGTIEGGDPGKNHEHVVFLGCTVENRPHCDVNGVGKLGTQTVEVDVASELALAGGLLVVLFEPLNGGEDFVELELTSLAGGAVKEKCATGTAGVTEVKGKVAAFVEPESEAAVSEGTLEFPTTAISEVERWKEGSYHSEKISLKALGLVAATESGITHVWLHHGGRLGVHCRCLG